MENLDKEVKELNDQRKEHFLSLRKKKINNYILKRRLGINNASYSIKKEEIVIKEEFKTKHFKDLNDLLNFSSSILGNEKSDINDIKFIICLLKMTEIKNDNGEISKSNILKEILKVFNNYINDLIIVDELISILINFTFYLTTETKMNLITNEYLNIFAKLATQYFKDETIFQDLIILLGNIVNDNIQAQKIFYQTNLFEEIYKLAQNPKAPKGKKNNCLLFLANFTIGIQTNNYFINNNQLLESLTDIMVSNLETEGLTESSLESIGNLSEIDSLGKYIVTKKELFFFIFEKMQPKYYIQGNKILVNLTYFNEDINLYLIENYKQAIPYIYKLLNISSNLIRGEMIFLLGNLIEFNHSKINEILYNNGLYDKIFEFIDSPFVEILEKVLYTSNIILSSLNKEGIFRLYQKNIHIKLLNILKNDYRRNIIDSVVDAIFEFILKDSQDRVIRQSFLDNGIREIFTNMSVDKNDAELYLKSEHILKSYFE